MRGFRFEVEGFEDIKIGLLNQVVALLKIFALYKRNPGKV